MTKQQTAPAEREFRAVHTNARVTATGESWSCEGCGKGGQEEDAVAFARDHARLCAILPLP